MIIVYCRLIEERREVLKILNSMGAIWDLGDGSNRKVQACDITNCAAHGRIYYVINDDSNPIKIQRRDIAPRGLTLSAADFIKVHADKLKKKEESFVEPHYPFALDGNPIELEKGSNQWYRQISCTATNVILNAPVITHWRNGSANAFRLAAIINGREKPYVGTPNGSTTGPLFVRVAAPEKVVKMTKAELQKLIAEKLGANVVLQIEE